MSLFGGLLIIIGSMPATFAMTQSNNGVLQTSHALSTLLDAEDPNSSLTKCQKQNFGSRLFSNRCEELAANLRKRMNTIAIDSDLQIQSEKIAEAKPSRLASTRISILNQINQQALAAEETIKTAQENSKTETKDDLSELLRSIQKVQASVSQYEKLIPAQKI